ncbi:hypothetical protein ARSEF1564_003030 [Beauveria bassiana]
MRVSRIIAFVGTWLYATFTVATVVTDQSAIVNGQTFDFVIAGAGLAGLTVANKLSAQNYSTLVIEAGPDGSWNNAVKYAGSISYPPTFCNRNYPQYDEKGHKLPKSIHAGGCIGGSTSINGMLWYRPTRAEIDRLETLGNPGWNWDTLEPLMEAIERNIPPNEEQILQGASYDPNVHGYHGVVNTSFPDQPGSAVSALVSKRYHNDTSIIDGRNIFGPEISLVNIDQIWPSSASAMTSSLTGSSSLRSRAQSLVEAGAAVNVEGAEMILNTTIELIIRDRLPVAEVVAESKPTALDAPFWPLMPLSRGHIHIASSDPFQNAIITPRFLTDAFDQAVGVAVARRIRNLFSNKAFHGVVENAYQYPPLGLNATDSEYLDWFKDTAASASHWLGSTAMLPRALGGVVDSRLRVYGTSKLHVVDAGILPFQLTSHTMSTLYAVAQRAAQIIVEDCRVE